MRLARLLGALLVLLASVAPGQSLGDLERSLERAREVREVQARRAAELERRLRDLSGEEARLNTSVKVLSGRIAGLEVERAALARRIADTDRRRRETEGRIAALEATVAEQKRQVQVLMRTLHRERSGRYVRLLARADSVYDLVIKGRYVNRLGDSDLEVIADLTANVARLEGERANLLGLVARLNADQRALVARQDALARERGKLRDRLAALGRTKAGQEAILYQTLRAQARTTQTVNDLVTKVVAERARIEEERRRRAEEERRRREEEARRRREEERRRREEAARIARIRDQQERERRAREERERAAAERNRREREEAAAEEARRSQAPLPPPVNLPRSVGALSFPVSGGAIEAGYGTAGQNFQTIRAPEAGAAVFAAAGGSVIAANLVQANTGYTVAVQHTPSLYTVYMNLQEPVVSVGQRVSRGDLLGYVGGGILLPANVLEFQVGVSAGGGFEYVDPNPYYGGS